MKSCGNCINKTTCTILVTNKPCDKYKHDYRIDLKQTLNKTNIMKSCFNCADYADCTAKEVLHADAPYCASWREQLYLANFEFEKRCMKKPITTDGGKTYKWTQTTIPQKEIQLNHNGNKMPKLSDYPKTDSRSYYKLDGNINWEKYAMALEGYINSL